MDQSSKPGWGTRLASYLVRNNLIYLYTIVCGTLSLFFSLFDRSGRLQHRMARAWSWLILNAASGCPLTVEGLENIDPTKPYIFAANHLSYLDTPVLFIGLPMQFRIMANANLFKIPFMGWHLRHSGQIPVERENARSSMRSLMAASKTVREGMSLVVFPEGGRTHDGHLQPFLNGAFFAAIRAGVSVVPATLIGTYEALPRGTWVLRPHRLKLVIGKPIPTESYTPRQMDELGAKVKAAISETYYGESSLKPPAEQPAPQATE
ncbi:MAG TPA: lysophospholipid acyltransferase family protein [Terriglobales bacterium]